MTPSVMDRLLIGLVTAITGYGLWATPAQGQAPASAVERLLSYHLDGSALWRQDNPGFKPGSGAPAYWIRQLRWGPAREVVVADAIAVLEEGRCQPVAHMVYFWDLANRRVAVNSYNAGGVKGQGHLEAKGSTGTLLFSTVSLPGGDTLRIREYSDNTLLDASTTHPERLVNGVWSAGDSVTWRRVAGPSPCGAGVSEPPR